MLPSLSSAQRTDRTTSRIYYTLRIASAMCFIGHGAFGIITKKVWLNYFAVFGIGPDLGYQLMPVLGTFDILLGVSLLVYPTRAVWSWLVIWGVITALLRPLSGEPVAETLERAGNYGAPLMLLVMSQGGARSLKGWFTRVGLDQIQSITKAQLAIGLRIVVFLLLAGHGWLNLIDKQGLLDQYTTLGFSDPLQVAHTVGVFEVVAAFSVLIRPVRSVLLALLIWKVGSELFYPRWEVFEWIERGGSYGSILALWLVLPRWQPVSVYVQQRQSVSA